MSTGGRAARSAGRKRRRRKRWAAGTVLLALLVAGGLAAWVVVQAGATPAQRAADRADGTGASSSGGVASQPSPKPPISGDLGSGEGQRFARVGELVLSEPSDDVTAIAFHEASYDDAMEMHPLGHLQENAAKGLFEPPPRVPGPGYLVQGSRGRGTGSTSAVDVMMPRTAAVLAPVDGVVRSAKRYKLYGKYPDWRIEIEPTGYPDLRVVIIHMNRVGVRRGDPVSATLSAIGAPRRLPFRSVVNDYVPGGDPHVHLEIKDLSAPPRGG